MYTHGIAGTFAVSFSGEADVSGVAGHIQEVMAAFANPILWIKTLSLPFLAVYDAGAVLGKPA